MMKMKSKSPHDLAEMDSKAVAPFKNCLNAPYTAIDLFAGIGGTRLGFHMTGKVKTVFASEIDTFSRLTYEANFGEVPSGDITKIASSDIPDHDILVGGFPCQAFSQAGKKRGFEDVRGTLFFEVARIVRDKRPKAFLLENVKNLVRHNGGETFKTILSMLKDLNYTVYYKVLAAKDFGLPQLRERIYIVGFDNEQVSTISTFAFPTPPNTVTKVADILEEGVDNKYTISDRLWQGHRRRKAENIAKGKGFGYGLVTVDSPYTNTLSARYYKDGSEILLEQVGKNPRRLTPREVARLQGFPDTYIIPVSDTQAYKQYGNSVAIPVIHAIAEEIIKTLDGNRQ